MNIAVLDPYPHICGPSVWAQHLKAGFTRLGHTCHYVTATKSGKPSATWAPDGMRHGCRWFPVTPDVTWKTRTVGEGLQAYDLTVLVEPRSIELDRECTRRGEEPWYIQALAHDVRWTTALHGPQYTEKLAPWLKTLIARAGHNLVTPVMTPSPRYVDATQALFDEADVLVHALPYEPRHPVDAPAIHRAVVGMTGRMVYNKGQHLLALVASELPPGWHVELWGACSIGAGPSFTRELREALELRGYKSRLLPDPLADPTGRGHFVEAMRRPYKWAAGDLDMHAVVYRGGYTPRDDVYRGLAVHVDLTSRAYSTGLVEFVTLEAIDAGCVPVMPQHLHAGSGFRALVLHEYEDAPTMSVTRRDFIPGQPMHDELVRALGAACQLAGNDESQLRLAAHNRRVLAARHAPAGFASAWLERLHAAR